MRPNSHMISYQLMRKDLRACVAALEDGVIDVELLTADQELDEIRDAEDPFKQLAEAIMKRLSE